MKILGLYNNQCALELFQWLSSLDNEVVLCTERILPQWCRDQNFDLTVSYTYRYILSDETIKALDNNVVNIHNALLPFNRGADPNIWSIIEKTPRGVSLHYVNSELDKGYLIAQEIIDENDDETLSSSYYKLDRAAKEMFKKAFKYYEFWPMLKKQCLGRGSYHSLNDGLIVKQTIDSYEISIDEFRKRLWGLKSGNDEHTLNSRGNNQIG